MANGRRTAAVHQDGVRLAASVNSREFAVRGLLKLFVLAGVASFIFELSLPYVRISGNWLVEGLYSLVGGLAMIGPAL